MVSYQKKLLQNTKSRDVTQNWRYSHVQQFLRLLTLSSNASPAQRKEREKFKAPLGRLLQTAAAAVEHFKFAPSVQLHTAKRKTLIVQTTWNPWPPYGLWNIWELVF